MIITTLGIIIRLDVATISQMGRVTKGVKLINLKEDNKVASISLVDKEESVEEEVE
jgi:DNA gyrase subunit A